MLSIDSLCFVFNCNLYKKSDRANLIFLELKKFHGKGGHVRFVLDYPREHKPNFHPIKFFSRRFKEAGFSFKYLHSGQAQHAKLLIFDKKIAVFGSHNLTSRSVISKHDLSIVLDGAQLLAELNAYFSFTWSVSVEA